MTQASDALRWYRRLAGAMALVVPVLGHAQSTARANEALKLIDQQQCEAAVDAINQGMRNNEPKSFYIAGQLFQYGFCLVQNVPRSLRLYERGALLGDRDSARTLALMHARGDGVPQSYQQAGRWYAVMRQEKAGVAEPSVESFAAPEVVVRTYIEAVTDLAATDLTYPRDAIDKSVFGTVKVRFDPRVARIVLLGSTDSTGSPTAPSPNRTDFERALLTSYADAIRVLPRPAMSPNIDHSIEHEVVFDRKIYVPNEPNGLQTLPR